ncbi:MAG: hypothetical protein ACE5GC_08925 [Acidimicrobiia bacterium]
MAVMVQTEPVTTEAQVATSVLRTYRARHERVSEVPLADMVSGALRSDVRGVKAVAAGDLRVTEIVVPEEMECAAVASAVWTLAARGWSVDVLVPSCRLGEAHAGLRGAPCRLQPWWVDDSEISFGGYETP